MDADYQFQPVDGHAVFEGVWSLTAPPGDDTIAPDTSCELIFHLGEPPLEETENGWRKQPQLMFYGPLTRVLRLRKEAPMKLAAIRLTPGGVGLLCEAPRALRNASHPMEDVLGADVANILVRQAEQSLSALATAASQHLSRPTSEKVHRIEHARVMLEETPSLTAGQMADRLGISIRTLDRSFVRQTGLRPGEFVRIFRYHSARRAVQAGSASLADIAVEHGYSDQAHMTREFQRFAGLTPRRKRAGEGADHFYDS